MLHHDYEVWLEKLAPHAPIDQYWHNRTGEDNADAQMKRQVMGREVVVVVTNGRPSGHPLILHGLSREKVIAIHSGGRTDPERSVAAGRANRTNVGAGQVRRSAGGGYC